MPDRCPETALARPDRAVGLLAALEEEIAAVFDPALEAEVIDLTEWDLTHLVIDLSAQVADRVVERVDVSDEDACCALRSEITAAMLDNFALADSAGR